MTSTATSPSRRAVAALVLALASVTGCNGNAIGAQDPPATMTDSTLTEIKYHDDTLTVAGIELTQFPGYTKSGLLGPPHGWHGVAEVAIESKAGRATAPVVTAVIFTEVETKRVGGDPAAFIQHAERMIYDSEVPSTGEGAVKGGRYHCIYRTKNGPMDDSGVTSASGVVIAMSEARPAIGVTVDGSDSEEIQRLTIEIAEAICS